MTENLDFVWRLTKMQSAVNSHVFLQHQVLFFASCTELKTETAAAMPITLNNLAIFTFNV